MKNEKGWDRDLPSLMGKSPFWHKRLEQERKMRNTAPSPGVQQFGLDTFGRIEELPCLRLVLYLCLLVADGLVMCCY